MVTVTHFKKSEPSPVAFSASVVARLFLPHFSLRVAAKYCATTETVMFLTFAVHVFEGRTSSIKKVLFY